MLISLKSKDSQNQWRRALLEKKKRDKVDEERGFMDQIRKIEAKVGVQSPQELCELIIEQGARTEELAHARVECEAERDELEEQLKQCEDDLAGLRGWKPGDRLTKELEKFDAPMEAARTKVATAAAALRKVDHLVAMSRVCFQGLCQKLEVHVPGLVRPSRPGSGRLRVAGLTRPKSFEDLAVLGGDGAGGVEDEEAEAQRAQKAQQLEEELNSLPAQLEAQMLKLQAAVSNNETIAAPSSSLTRGGAQQQVAGGGGGERPRSNILTNRRLRPGSMILQYNSIEMEAESEDAAEFQRARKSIKKVSDLASRYGANALTPHDRKEAGEPRRSWKKKG